jgi:uncharacterized small protein (DUF1192 family)
MTRKALRRLDLRLPADHPIFEVPAGKRARAAECLLGAADAWCLVLDRLAALESRLAAVEERLARLEAGGVKAVETEDAAEGFDAAGFFASFD